MDLFHSMQVFSKVFQEQNFSKVSQAMQMNTSSVSRIISKLEEEMNAPLFIRNTRKITPTEVGEHFYLKVQQILELVDGVTSDLKSYKQQKIRVHIGPDVAHFFSLDLTKIMREHHPDSDFEFSFDSDFPDIVQDNIDFSLSMTALKDSGLIARKIHDGDLGVFYFGGENDSLIIPKSLSGRIEKSMKVDGAEDIVFGQTLEVSDFSRALTMAKSLGGHCILPLWYAKFFDNSDEKLLRTLDADSLLGNNYGLYLVYTYNRYKKKDGKETVDHLLSYFKDKLN